MGQHFTKVYDYHVWANNKVFERLKNVPAEIVQKEIQSVFPTILDAMRHICTVDTVWFHVMSGKGFGEIVTLVGGLSEELKTKNINEIESSYHDITHQYLDLFSGLEKKDKPIICEHPQYGRLDTNLSELVQHVVNHGTYHRGNITAMLRQLGYPGASSDYIFYLFERSKGAKT